MFRSGGADLSGWSFSSSYQYFLLEELLSPKLWPSQIYPWAHAAYKISSFHSKYYQEIVSEGFEQPILHIRSPSKWRESCLTPKLQLAIAYFVQN
ncbi:hypothetical protein AB1N83_012042 [Pleurotus pulmonarius]